MYSDGRVTVPRASEVVFIEEGRELSIVPDKEYQALTVLPKMLGAEELTQYPAYPDTVYEIRRDEMESFRVQEDCQITVPAFARAESGSNSGSLREIEAEDTVYFVGRCDERDQIARLYLLTHPEFVLGVHYRNASVQWVGDSKERLRDSQLDVVHDWMAGLDAPVRVRIDDCADFESVFADTDELLWASVRDLRPSARRRVYDRLVGEFDTVREDFVSQVNDIDWLRKVTDETTPDVSVRVSADKGEITRLELRAPGSSDDTPSATVTNPASLWDCPCRTETEGYVLDTQTPLSDECPVHSRETSYSAPTTLGGEVVAITHDGVTTYWCDSATLRPPSIDTYRLYQTVEASLDSDATTSILEVGTVTGFLATGLASSQLPVSEVTATARLLQPTVIAGANMANNLSSLDIRFRVWPDPGIDRVRDETSPAADVCVCGPLCFPPITGSGLSGEGETVVGTELLEDVIGNAPRLGSDVYVAYSELVEQEVARICEATGHTVREMERNPTPLRVSTNTLDDSGELQRRGLRHRPTEMYPYWHDVVIASVEC